MESPSSVAHSKLIERSSQFNMHTLSMIVPQKDLSNECFKQIQNLISQNQSHQSPFTKFKPSQNRKSNSNSRYSNKGDFKKVVSHTEGDYQDKEGPFYQNFQPNIFPSWSPAQGQKPLLTPRDMNSLIASPFVLPSDRQLDHKKKASQNYRR
mmetsp:Transcript_29085/g.28079  ORF Transcript_29085/g.28079 Transcript_29085/m.28079 type:complete len:152 (+) Transcript_29085:3174-3629(+)